MFWKLFLIFFFFSLSLFVSVCVFLLLHSVNYLVKTKKKNKIKKTKKIIRYIIVIFVWVYSHSLCFFLCHQLINYAHFMDQVIHFEVHRDDWELIKCVIVGLFFSLSRKNKLLTFFFEHWWIPRSIWLMDGPNFMNYVHCFFFSSSFFFFQKSSISSWGWKKIFTFPFHKSPWNENKKYKTKSVTLSVYWVSFHS